MSVVSVDELRLRLAGKLAEPDILDAVADLVRLGDDAAVAKAADCALSLLDDPDVTVRHRAVELLRVARNIVEPARLASALVAAWDGTDEAGAEALLLLADLVGDGDGDALELVLEWLDDPRLRGSLLNRLARSVPRVLANDAARLLRPGDASMLLRLPAAHRAMAAGKLGPWATSDVDLLLDAQLVRPIPPRELATLLDAIATTRPSSPRDA